MKRFFVYAGLAIILFLFLAAQEDGCSSDEDTDQSPTATVTEAVEDEASEATEATPTPQPAPEDADIVDLAETLAYLDGLGALTTDMALVMDNLVGLSTEAADDPTVLLDEGWFRDLEREQDRLKAAQSTFLALRPPPQLTETHLLMTQALTEMDIALDLFEAGGRDFDPAKLSEAAGHLEDSTRFIVEATEALPE